MAEYRLAPRIHRKQRGVVILKDRIEVDCTILDISESGARIAFQSRIILPKRFKLRLVASGRSVQVSVIWQKETQAGVRFAARLPEMKAKRGSVWHRLF